MSVTTSSRSSASERSSSGSADESWMVNPQSCGQRSKMFSSLAARSSSSGGSSAFRLPSWAGFIAPMPQGPCPCSSVQITHEGLAQARRERDLENEKVAGERRRIDVIRQARAVAHAEPEKLRTTRENRLDARVA